MTLVKICGVRSAEVAVEAAKAGADFIGLMFAESRRKVSPQECYDIVEAIHKLRKVPGPVTFNGPAREDVSARSWFAAWSDAIEETLFRCRPLVVGVFADQPADEVAAIVNAAKLDLVQLSGDENGEFASKIPVPVVKAVHVREGMDALEIRDRAIDSRAEAAMLDTASASARGGTGVAFDWAVAEEAARSMPFMLAGGLTPENVAEAVSQVHPWAVDVSSGVETDGQKDIEKVRAFIAAAKGGTRGN